jgi:circadian clock protein KaiC
MAKSMERSKTEVAAATRSTTGVPGLDDILGGGFTPNRLYLIDGDPGAGKTTLALQYLREGARLGEKCLYVTLSETREELESVAASHAWSLEGVEILELIANETELNTDTQLTMYHPSEVELNQTTRTVIETVNRTNPQRVVIDSLAELRMLAQNSLRYRRQILALKQFFIGRQSTVLLLDDQTATGTDKQLQSIAHGVVDLEQLAPEFGGQRRRLRVVKFRASGYRGGYHDFNIERGGIVTFPRLVAAEHGQEFSNSMIKSGVSTLDSLLGGGPHRGTSTLLIGPAGVGKSTIAVQYAVAAAERGDHAVIFSFDESTTLLAARLDSMGIRFSEGRKKGQVRVKQIDPAELSPGEFTYMVRRAVEEDGAKIVVIDSLNGYLNAMPEERFLVIQLHELLSYLSNQGVTTLMVIAQHGLMGAGMQSPIDASYLSDSVVVLRYFEHAGHVKKAISVLKKRSGMHEDSIRELRFSSKGIELSEPLEEFQGILTGVPWRLRQPESGAQTEGGK